MTQPSEVTVDAEIAITKNLLGVVEATVEMVESFKRDLNEAFPEDQRIWDLFLEVRAIGRAAEKAQIALGNL